MKKTVDEILEMSEIVEPKEKFDIIKEDPEDNIIIECAVEGKVDYIITKDTHLLNLKEFKGIKIITSKDMISLLTKNNYLV